MVVGGSGGGELLRLGNQQSGDSGAPQSQQRELPQALEPSCPRVRRGRKEVGLFSWLGSGQGMKQGEDI